MSFVWASAHSSGKASVLQPRALACLSSHCCQWGNEKTLYTRCGPGSALCSELSGVKRCVWGNLPRNLTSVAMTRMPSISLLLFICRRKPGIGIGKPIYAFFNIFISVFEGVGSPLHLAPLRVPWVYRCHAAESQCLAVSSLASFSVGCSISEDMYMVAYVHNLDINT